nr:hypothetical protein [Tanacetum cinerariifolium]
MDNDRELKPNNQTHFTVALKNCFLSSPKLANTPMEDGQSIDVDAPPDIIDVVDEDDDIIDEEDPIPYDLVDSDDDDLVNLDIDDGVNVVYSSEEED